MEKRITTIVPILIVPQLIEPGTGADIPGAEVGVVFRCGSCGKPIADMAQADLIIDLDPDAVPGASLGQSDDFEGEHLYEIKGAAAVVHRTKECNGSEPGVRISALRWVAKGGRTQFRPRIRPNNSSGKVKEGSRLN